MHKRKLTLILFNTFTSAQSKYILNYLSEQVFLYLIIQNVLQNFVQFF